MWYHFHRNNARFMAVAVTVFLVFLLPINGGLLAQAKYPKGRIHLKIGTIIEGKRLEIGPESAKLTVAGIVQTFPLTDITQIMAKRGYGRRMGPIFGGGCFGVAMVAYLATGGEIETTDKYGYTETEKVEIGTYLVGTAMWAAICYGGGYLVGMAMDDWQMVYFAPQ